MGNSVRKKEQLGLLLGPLLAGAVFVFLPPTLSPSARVLATILTWVVVYWVTEPIPIPITALVGSGLCVFTGLGSMKTVFSAYAHPVIFLFIGSFFLAEAVVVHGLDRRFGLWLLTRPWVALHPRRVLIAMGCAVAGLSMWISNTAAAALMLPIALGVLSAIRGPQDTPTEFDKGMLLLIAYGAGVGGVATVIGTPPNLIGVALLSEQAGTTLSFGTWMAIGFPLALVMLVVVTLLLLWLFPPPISMKFSIEAIQAQRAHLGKWSIGERNACLAFGVAVGLWLMPGFLSAGLGVDHSVVLWFRDHLPKELVPILAAGLLFLLPIDFKGWVFTLSWKQAVNINWGTILLFGGGIAFGHLMVNTGLAKSVGEGLVGVFGVHSLWGLTALAIFAGVVLTELASNTAAASMIVPVVIAIAQAAGVSPLPPTLGACMGASLAFVLPVSTPPNAIVYGTGSIPITSMIRAGVILDAVGGVVVWGALRVLCPLFGIL